MEDNDNYDQSPAIRSIGGFSAPVIEKILTNMDARCSRNTWTSIGWLWNPTESHKVMIKNIGPIHISYGTSVGLVVGENLTSYTIVAGEPADNQIGFRKSGDYLQCKQRISDTDLSIHTVIRFIFR